MVTMRALKTFDAQEGFIRRGETFETTEARAKVLEQATPRRAALARRTKPKPGPSETKPSEPSETKPKTELKHVGGGWYELPNGERVQGKEAAEEALKK